MWKYKDSEKWNSGSLNGDWYKRTGSKKIVQAHQKWIARLGYREYNNQMNNDDKEHNDRPKQISNDMIKVLNIINLTYCNKCNKKRITNTHLERDHQEILPKYNVEKI